MIRSRRNLDKRTAFSLLDLRCYVECPAMEILASHHTDQDIATLKELGSRGENGDILCEGALPIPPHADEASGNTVTPLVINALVSTSLPFWSDYEQLAGPDAALERLEQFTRLIEAGAAKKLHNFFGKELRTIRKCMDTIQSVWVNKGNRKKGSKVYGKFY